jgi:RING finger protein 113A
MAGERELSSDAGSNYEISEQNLDQDIGKVDPADGLPTVCRICEKPFKDPIVTLCKHYFCEPCALQNYLSDQKCFVCGQETKGSFITAANIEAKLRAPKREPEQTPEDETLMMESYARKQTKSNRFETQNGWIIP